MRLRVVDRLDLGSLFFQRHLIAFTHPELIHIKFHAPLPRASDPDHRKIYRRPVPLHWITAPPPEKLQPLL
ncbi:hypothetical protein GMST_12060 [Geomonas silvestris]|uniref:Uncharacterized protein n=1 Tax=Geomonas silvestris TaxID=2740184 RepID=A0A6V8MFU4_9BACT|nr:hypothetical protein GMST_12060 [Geomonas silvestris]